MCELSCSLKTLRSRWFPLDSVQVGLNVRLATSQAALNPGLKGEIIWCFAGVHEIKMDLSHEIQEGCGV